MTRLHLDLRQGPVWRLIAVVAVPFVVWLTMGDAYEFRHERRLRSLFSAHR